MIFDIINSISTKDFLGKYFHSKVIFDFKNYSLLTNNFLRLTSVAIVFFLSVACSDTKAGNDEKLSAEMIVQKSIDFTNHSNIYSKVDINSSGYIFEINDKKTSFEYFFLAPDMMRFRTKFDALTTNLVLNGDSGWSKLNNFPTLPIDNALRNKISIVSSVYFPEIFGYKKLSDSIYYDGISKVNGLEAHKVVLIDRNGAEIDYYFSSTDFRIVKLTKTISFKMEPVNVEVYYEEYADFGGIKFPTLIESYSGDKELKFKIETINYDSGLNENDFVKPN